MTELSWVLPSSSARPVLTHCSQQRVQQGSLAFKHNSSSDDMSLRSLFVKQLVRVRRFGKLVPLVVGVPRFVYFLFFSSLSTTSSLFRRTHRQSSFWWGFSGRRIARTLFPTPLGFQSLATVMAQEMDGLDWPLFTSCILAHSESWVDL